MGASAERIALEIAASTSGTAEVAKLRSETSALGDAAAKTRRAYEESGGDLTRMAQIYAGLTSATRTETQARQASNAEIARGELALRRYEITHRRAEQAAHAMDAALEREQRRMVALHAEALRMDEALTRQATTVTTTGMSFEQMGLRGRSAFVAMAFGFEGFARSLQSGESGIRAGLRSLSTLSFLIGPEVGLAVTGAATLGDAIYEMWNRTEKAARAAEVQFQHTLETLAHGGLLSAAEERQRLYSGDPLARLTGPRAGESAIAFLGRSGGQRDLEAEQARLSSRLAEINRLTNQGTTATTAQMQERKSYIAQLKEVNAELATYDLRLARVDSILPSLTSKEKERAAFELQQMRARAALAESRRLRPEEVPLTIGNLSEQERAFGITGRGFGAGIRGVSSIDLLAQAQSAAQRVDTTRLGRIQAATITETPFHAMQVEMEKQIEALGDRTRQRLGNTLADSLAAGITAGFAGGGVKGAFAAAGRTLLAGLGGIFIDLGKTYLQYSGIMEALTPLLGNPFTAGYAGAAIGAALIGLGAALEGVGQRQGGGGGGAAATGSVFTPNAVAGAGGTTIVIQTIDPLSRGVISSTIYEINRSGMLNTPVVPPYGRPS